MAQALGTGSQGGRPRLSGSLRKLLTKPWKHLHKAFPSSFHGRDIPGADAVARYLESESELFSPPCGAEVDFVTARDGS